MSETKAPKKTRGKCKIPLQEISNKKYLYVSFSKRRTGLFKKSAALCSTFPNDLQMVAIVFSPSGKLFSFGNPNPDAVINRFLAQQGNMEMEHKDKRFWWDDLKFEDFEDFNLEQLQQLKSSLEHVKNLALDKAIDGCLIDENIDH